MKRKRTDLSSSGSSSGSDEIPMKDDRLSGGVEKSEAASEGVLKQERRGGRERGGRGGGGGRGRRGRGGGGGRKGRGREEGRGRGRGGRGNKRLTSKGRTTRDVDLSASSSSSDGEFDSIVKSLEEEDLKLLLGRVKDWVQLFCARCLNYPWGGRYHTINRKAVVSM